jgi:GMP synthase-like glutamine amidotransferase
VGLTQVTRADDEQTKQVVPSFHYQSISPDIRAINGVRIDWRNDHTAVQAFSYGTRVFGHQFHPELSRTDVHELIDFHSDVITQWNGDTTAAHRSVDRHADALPPDLFHRMITNHIPR